MDLLSLIMKAKSFLRRCY